MKKLFLASSAYVSLSLCKEILPKNPHEMTIAFSPTAADPYENQDFVEWDRDALRNFGMTLIEVDLKIKQGIELEKILKQVDAIFVAGGNTFYLLDWVRKSGFDAIVKKLIDQGMPYFGSSAGSVLACSTIEGAKLFDDPAKAPDLTDYQGLNLIDFAIIPHAQKEKYRERIEITTKELEGKNIKFVTLSDDQAVVVVGDSLTIKTLPISPQSPP